MAQSDSPKGSSPSAANSGMQSSNRRGRPLDPEAGFRRVAALLGEKIRTGHYASHMVLPSSRRLAATYKVSDHTVRRALRHLKSQGLIQVSSSGQATVIPPGHELHTEPGYLLEVVADSLGRVLRTAYFADLQRGIELEAGRLNAPLVIAHAVRFKKLLPDDQLRLPLRGIVLVGQFESAILQKYSRSSVPVVIADMPMTTQNFHCVCADNERAAFELTSKLLSEGHRRIAFLRRVRFNPRGVDVDAQERQLGFEKALAEAGIDDSRSHIYNLFRKDTPASPAIRSILQANPVYSAVVACDPTAARICKNAIAAASGKKCKLALHTFLSRNEPGDRLAARFDFLEMGRQAVRMLASPRNPPQVIRIPAVLA